MKEKWEQIVYDLRGSCSYLAFALEEHGVPELEDNDDFLKYLDDQIFCYAGCGRWYEQPDNESFGEWYCDNCYEDADDE